VWAYIHAADGTDSSGGGFGIRFVGPGQTAWGSGEGRDVGHETGEGFVACNAAAVERVDKAEARLCLGAAVHVGLSEHEVKVGTDCVGKGEGCEVG
jgi:hypothetical protein